MSWGLPSHFTTLKIQPDLQAEEDMEECRSEDERDSGSMVGKLVRCPVGHLFSQLSAVDKLR